MTSSIACSSPVTSNSIAISINASVPASVSITNSANNICPGSAITFTAIPSNGGNAPSYQWFVNGAKAGANSPIFATSSLVNGDIVSCVMTNNSTCALNAMATSNSISITVSSSAQPSVSITSSAISICSGSPVTFTAVLVNGGSSPLFLWQVNGTSKAVTNSFIVFSDLSDGDVVNCVMTSSAVCSLNETATSNGIAISVSSTMSPSVSIVSSFINICKDSSITFTASPVNGGSEPSFQWQLNGNIAGTNNSIFNTSSLVNGDVVSCIMTSNLACVSPADATSNSITVNISAGVNPLVEITASANNICSDSNVTFTANATNGGSTPAYQWLVNGINVGTNSSTYSSNNLKNGDVVNCILTSSEACTSPVSAASGITMIIYPLPIISQNVPLTINEGSSIQLNPIIIGNITRYVWFPSAGLSNNNIQNPTASPLSTVTYLLTVTSVEGCSDTASFPINVIDVLDIPNVFSPNGDGINDLWRIPYLANLPACTVDVFDRYGQLVFHANGYGKPWDGTSNGRQLPIATYYYVVDPKNGHKKVAGSVTILK